MVFPLIAKRFPPRNRCRDTMGSFRDLTRLFAARSRAPFESLVAAPDAREIIELGL
jgi:hypothetical protein